MKYVNNFVMTLSFFLLTSMLPAGCDRMSQPAAFAGSEVADMNPDRLEKATFAAGCFWGVEAVFQKITGVVNTTVGYTGGHTANPTYRDVCSGDTGHAEAVLIEFDPETVSYNDLLVVFWNTHNPTTLNRQGPDIGDQYRSAIFYHDDHQKELALDSIDQLRQSSHYDRPIVTQVVPATEFYKAEEYHQQYLQKKGAASCHI